MKVLGWDVGGANVKAAQVHRDGPAEPTVVERPFALWREPESLPDVLAEVAERLGGSGSVGMMAVTMTAELADCFATKREGVGFVLDAFRAAFAGTELQVYGVDGRFRSVEEARHRPYEVAAANWRGSATLVARTFPDGIFLDVGSTTTDVIPIVGGAVAAAGCTDPARLQSGELVYTGLLRTPVAAIVRSVPFGGRRCRVAAEHFAVSADAHLWLGKIDESGYACETPDGRGRSRSEAGARLARVVCGDLEMLGAADITAIAEHISQAQVSQIASAIRQVRRHLDPARPCTAVLAGQGAFLGRLAAEELGLTIRELSDDLGAGAARSAPAVAVALLLSEIAEEAG